MYILTLACDACICRQCCRLDWKHKGRYFLVTVMIKSDFTCMVGLALCACVCVCVSVCVWNIPGLKRGSWTTSPRATQKQRRLDNSHTQTHTHTHTHRHAHAHTARHYRPHYLQPQPGQLENTPERGAIIRLHDIHGSWLGPIMISLVSPCEVPGWAFTHLPPSSSSTTSKTTLLFHARVPGQNGEIRT